MDAREDLEPNPWAVIEAANEVIAAGRNILRISGVSDGEEVDPDDPNASTLRALSGWEERNKHIFRRIPGYLAEIAAGRLRPEDIMPVFQATALDCGLSVISEDAPREAAA
jgi:hypothetical protein